MYNVTGKLLSTQQIEAPETVVDVKSLSSGLYYLVLMDNTQGLIIVESFVKGDF